MLIVLVVFAVAATAQTIGTTGYNSGQGIINMDKLGAHQNGGRGCTGCHAPHSGARGNGGSLTVNSALTGNKVINNISYGGAWSNQTAIAGDSGDTELWGQDSGARGNGGSLTVNSQLGAGTIPGPNVINGVSYGGNWSNQTAIAGDSGNEELWGQDIGPVMGKAPFGTGGTESNPGGFIVDFSQIGVQGAYGRMLSGIVFCLSCHDGQVAKGAMMTNASYEQAAGLLPSTYGSQTIPTLLGADGGAAGNYLNDHPIGPQATVAAVGIKSYVALDSTTAPTKLVASANFAGSPYQTFQTNYGLPTVLGARAGAGWAVDSLPTNGTYTSDNAYVVCTTCHTPHTMFKASASSSNPIAGNTSGYYPTFFFLAAPYNPAANVQNGAYASSATQFCRQCHFQGAGGSNESIGINNIPTAF